MTWQYTWQISSHECTRVNRLNDRNGACIMLEGHASLVTNISPIFEICSKNKCLYLYDYLWGAYEMHGELQEQYWKFATLAVVPLRILL